MEPVVTARPAGGRLQLRTRSGHTLIAAAGGDDAPGPMELMAGSLAGCAADTLGQVLERMRRPVDGLAVAVAGERADRPPRVWTRLEVTYLVRGELPEDRLSRAVEVTERTCSASAMLARATALTSRWVAVRRVEPAATRPLRQRILRPHQTLAELVAPGEEDMSSGWFAGVRDDGEVVACVGIMHEASPDHPGREDAWRLRAMAVEPALRSAGLGRLLVDAVVDHVTAAGGGLVWCSARVPARGFYESAGFVATSDVYDQEPIGPHLRMELDLG